jgi:hypothetical protein
MGERSRRTSSGVSEPPKERRQVVCARVLEIAPRMQVVESAMNLLRG